MQTKWFWSISNHHKWLSQLFPLHLNTYGMGLWRYTFSNSFSVRDRLYTSESDVYRRQIMTCKVDPRAERVKQEKRRKYNIMQFLVIAGIVISDPHRV